MTYPSTIHVPPPVKYPMHGGMTAVGTLSILAIVIGVIFLIIGNNGSTESYYTDASTAAWGIVLVITGAVMTSFWGMTLAVISAIRSRP